MFSKVNLLSFLFLFLLLMSLVDGFTEKGKGRDIYIYNLHRARVKGRERDDVGSIKGKNEARGQKWDMKAKAAHVDTTLLFIPRSTFHSANFVYVTS